MILQELIQLVKDKVGPAVYNDDSKIVSEINSAIRELALMKPMWVSGVYQTIDFVDTQVSDAKVLICQLPIASFFIEVVKLKYSDDVSWYKADYIEIDDFLSNILDNENREDLDRLFWTQRADNIQKQSYILLYPVEQKQGTLQLYYYAIGTEMIENDEEVLVSRYFPDYIVYMASAKVCEDLNNLENANYYRGIANQLMQEIIYAQKIKERKNAHPRLIPAEESSIFRKNKNMGGWYE